MKKKIDFELYEIIHPPVRGFHRTFIGKTGSGKSYLAGALLEQEVLKNGANFVVVDLKKNDNFYLCTLPNGVFIRLDERKIHLTENEWYKIIYENPRLVVIRSKRISWEDTQESAMRIIHATYLVGNRILYLDEAHAYFDNRKPLDPRVRDAIQLGQASNLSVWCVTQRPANLHADVFSQSTLIYSARLTDKNDHDRVKTYFTPDELMKLGKYEFRLYTDDAYTPNKTIKVSKRITKHLGGERKF